MSSHNAPQRSVEGLPQSFYQPLERLQSRERDNLCQVVSEAKPYLRHDSALRSALAHSQKATMLVLKVPYLEGLPTEGRYR